MNRERIPESMSEETKPQNTNYCASVEAGLRRLENEKLSFLASGNVISKFDPKSLEAFHVPTSQDEGDTLDDSTQENLFIDKTLETFPEELSEDLTKDETQPDQVLVGNDERDREHEIPTRESGVLTIERTQSQAMDSEEEDQSIKKNLTAMAEIVRQQSQDLREFEEQAQKIRASLDMPRTVKSQVIKPATVRSGHSVSGKTAMERLKNEGIFDKLPVHSEVSESLDHIQSLDTLLPPSSIEPYSDETRESLTKSEEIVARSQSMAVKTEESSYPMDYDFENCETIPVNLKAFTIEELEQVDVENDEERSAGQRGLIIGIALAVVLIVIMGVIAVLVVIHQEGREGGARIQSVLEREHKPDRVEVKEAVEEAVSIVSNVYGSDAWVSTWVDEKIKATEKAEDLISIYETAILLTKTNENFLRAFTMACIEAGSFEYARDRLKEFSDDPDRRAVSLELRDMTFAKDPQFNAPILSLSENECDVIDPLGGGSTLTFKCKLNGVKVGAIKPEQSRKQSNYRSEIAAWRLCELLECAFQIPWNRPVRIEHSVFEKLYGRSQSSSKKSYRSNFEDLTWRKEEGKTWVYATLKDWVSDFTLFPIEFVDLWKPWLDEKSWTRTDYPELAQALAPIGKKKNVSKYLPKILEQSPMLKTEDLASQISDVIVFDYLTENWDRFSTSLSYWGVNCQFKDNHIVSIDNGASFPNYTNEAVLKRFKMVRRFNRKMIENLRNLDKERTLNLLFPNPSQYEMSGFEIFWRHRTYVIETVDALESRDPRVYL